MRLPCNLPSLAALLAVASGLGMGTVGCTPAPSLAGFGSGDQRQTSDDAIINGSASDASQDAVVLIAFPAGACSGTLVAKNLVLTARHCVGQMDNKTLEVTNASASSIKIFTGSDAPAKRDANKSAATGRRLFTVGTNMIPDIAFVLLDRDVTAPVAPIRLRGGAKKGEPLTIVGFGLTENNETSAERLQRTGKSVVNVFPDATSIGFELNKGEFTFTEAACSGDSGGPALSATTKAVVGVASRVGNGQEQSQDDPSAFCRGENTTNIYTSLEAVPELVDQAFTAANAQARLETTGTGATEPEEPGEGEAEPTPDAGTKPPATPTEPTEPEPTEATEPEERDPNRRPEVDPNAEPSGSSDPDKDTNAAEPPPSGTRKPSTDESEPRKKTSDDDDDDSTRTTTRSAGACSAGVRGGLGSSSHGVASAGLAALALAFVRRGRRRTAR